MPDNITFATIPVDIRTPGQYIEFDNSMAIGGLAQQPRRALILGHRLAAGAIPAGQMMQLFGDKLAVGYWGRGSQIAEAVAAFKLRNPYTQCYGLAIDDLAGGTKSTWVLTFGGTATASGQINLMINGNRLQIGVLIGDVADDVAADVVAAITANLDLPVAAAAVDGVVTLTSRHKGAFTADLPIFLNYWEGDALPAGITLGIAAGVTGTGNPDVTALFAAFGDRQFNTMIGPWTDAANVHAIEAQLDNLWGGMKQKTGHYFAAYRGTLSAISTYGQARNSVQDSVIGIGNVPQAGYIWAAMIAAEAEFSAGNDPAAPIQNIPIEDLLPPPVVDRWEQEDRDVLLRNGISTWFVDAGGVVNIERIVTTYQENSFGVADVSYLNIETKNTIDYLRFGVRAWIAQRYPRHKLVGDETPIPQGQKMVSPSTLTASLIAFFTEAAAVGLVEDLEQFKRDLLVLRSTTDMDRVNAILPFNIVNQFRVFAAAVQFRL